MTAAARVARVNGPLVEVEGLAGAAMSNVVELGERGLAGEVVAIRGDVTTVQAYEYTGGLAPGGTRARSLGLPLSARLGPHLLGGIFDGLLRPLTGAPARLEPGRPREVCDQPGVRIHPRGGGGRGRRRRHLPGIGGRGGRYRVPGPGTAWAERDRRGGAGRPAQPTFTR